MNNSGAKCIDLGSERCPCSLAYSKDCIYCSLLAGREECQCQWQGVCVLSEMNEIKGQGYKGESFKRVEIVDLKSFGEKMKVITLKVGKGFAIKAMRAGSYTFAKALEYDTRFSIPLSILYSNPKEGIIKLAVNQLGPKSKTLLKGTEMIDIKGIFSNGIIGVRRLEKTLMNMDERNRRINFFVRGLGMAPLINIIEIVKDYPNYMIYYDDETLHKEFVKGYLGKVDIEKMRRVSFPGDINALKSIAMSKDGNHAPLNVVLSSDFYIKEMLSVDKEIVYANNSNLCCGEGICGSCTCTDEKGILHRMCKEWA